jgi:hypothetical protein
LLLRIIVADTTLKVALAQVKSRMPEAIVASNNFSGLSPSPMLASDHDCEVVFGRLQVHLEARSPKQLGGTGLRPAFIVTMKLG